MSSPQPKRARLAHSDGGGGDAGVATSVASSVAPFATRIWTERPLVGVSAAGFAAVISAAGGRAALAGMTTAAVKAAHIVPATAAAAVAYADLLRERPYGAALVGNATRFLSHAYDYDFLDTVDAATAWETRNPREGGGTHFFYFDLIAVNQHAGGVIVPFETLCAEFGGGVRSVPCTLFMLDYMRPISLSRAWCVFEAAAALAAGSRFEVVMASRSEATFAKALVSDFDSLVQKTCTVDVERATAREPADEANIKRAIEASLGGFAAVNKLVIGAMHAWMAAAGRDALRALPPAARATSSLQDRLARLLLAQAKYGEAGALFRDALAGRRAAYGDAHPDTLLSMNNLAWTLQAEGKLADAEPLYREALARRRALLGGAALDTLVTMNNLAFLLKARDGLAEAEPLFREALAGRRAALGDTHPDTLLSKSNLAGLLKDKGALAEAEPLSREVLAERRAALGAAHPSTLSSVASLAALLSGRGADADAKPLLREALAGRRAALGDAHALALQSARSLVCFLERLGRADEAAAVRLYTV